MPSLIPPISHEKVPLSTSSIQDEPNPICFVEELETQATENARSLHEILEQLPGLLQEVSNIKEHTTQLEESNKILKDNLVQTEEQLKNKEITLEKYQTEVQLLQSKLDASNLKIKELNKIRSSLENQIEQLQQEHSEQLKDLNSQMDQLNIQNQTYEDAILSLNQSRINASQHTSLFNERSVLGALKNQRVIKEFAVKQAIFHTLQKQEPVIQQEVQQARQRATRNAVYQNNLLCQGRIQQAVQVALHQAEEAHTIVLQQTVQAAIHQEQHAHAIALQQSVNNATTVAQTDAQNTFLAMQTRQIQLIDVCNRAHARSEQLKTIRSTIDEILGLSEHIKYTFQLNEEPISLTSRNIASINANTINNDLNSLKTKLEVEQLTIYNGATPNQVANQIQTFANAVSAKVTRLIQHIDREKGNIPIYMRAIDNGLTLTKNEQKRLDPEGYDSFHNELLQGNSTEEQAIKVAAQGRYARIYGLNCIQAALRHTAYPSEWYECREYVKVTFSNLRLINITTNSLQHLKDRIQHIQAYQTDSVVPQVPATPAQIVIPKTPSHTLATTPRSTRVQT